MILDKRQSLKPLLESADGIHLTGYLVNRGDLIDLKQQIGEVVRTAREFLAPVMSREEWLKFAEPLEALRFDARILKRMKDNVGLFRTIDSFRVLNVPVDVEPACVVATSFHVKPLLRWMQEDLDFLILGLEKSAAHLYLGNQNSLVRLDSFYYPSALERDSLNDWISELTSAVKPRLFVAGDRELTNVFYSGSKYSNAHRDPIYGTFGDEHAHEIANLARERLKQEVSLRLEKALAEFRLAAGMNLSKKNIFLIAKAAIQGRVRKLIVADGIKIFGRLDPKSGGLALHPFDLDHEDDDILDDLAQTVLSKGGEVIVASRDKIPKGRPILAILKHKDPEMNVFEYEDLGEERERRAT